MDNDIASMKAFAGSVENRATTWGDDDGSRSGKEMMTEED